MEVKAQARAVLLTSSKGNLLSTVLHCLQWTNLSLGYTISGQICWAMVFTLFFCSKTQSCPPELVGREDSREAMSQEESDQERHFPDTPKWLGAFSDPFLLAAEWVTFAECVEAKLGGALWKGLEMQMVSQLPPGVGDIWLKYHFSHSLLSWPCSTSRCVCWPSWDLPGWRRTRPFPVIPDSHCTGLLSHAQGMDLAGCSWEHHIYFMPLPVCCLHTKLARRLFELD